MEFRTVMLPALLAKKAVLAMWTMTGLIVALAVDPTTFAAAVVTILSALTGSAVIIINALSRMKKEILEAQASVATSVKVVEGHVDGMATAAAAKRTADDDTIISLRLQLSEAQQTAKLLAQSKSTTDAIRGKV